jgi:hypothetical protein
MRLPFALQQARAQGYKLPDTLTFEQIAQIVLGYAVIILTIAGLAVLKQNLKIRLRIK